MAGSAALHGAHILRAITSQVAARNRRMVSHLNHTHGGGADTQHAQDALSDPVDLKAAKSQAQGSHCHKLHLLRSLNVHLCAHKREATPIAKAKYGRCCQRWRGGLGARANVSGAVLTLIPLIRQRNSKKRTQYKVQLAAAARGSALNTFYWHTLYLLSWWMGSDSAQAQERRSGVVAVCPVFSRITLLQLSLALVVVAVVAGQRLQNGEAGGHRCYE
jgi:hypothetical protein